MKKIPQPHQAEALEAINKNDEGQIHLPTASGKTLIQANAILYNFDKGREWIRDNYNNEGVPVFVVLSPRILLSNQLFKDIRDIIIDEKLDAHYLIVHSGKTSDDKNREWSPDLPYRQLKSTTKTSVIREEYDKAKEENVPLIIFGTYDSAERISSSHIPVYLTCCDEAHYLVSREFSYIADEDGLKFFPSHRKYYFTATPKETISDEGLGLNNFTKFGHIIYTKTPLEMIKAGIIVRPRIHLIDISSSSEKADEITRDVNAILDGFTEHLMFVSSGAKLLVVTKGSEHLNDVVTHPKMRNFLERRPNMRIFDISSAYNPRINGVVVTREQFLNDLQGLTDRDEAIIFHINILSEGIDVPGITAVMPMNSMGMGKLLQTLGRATRLHPIDRGKIYAGQMKYDELDRFIKPYAWIIIPVYGMIGTDLMIGISEIIYRLRGFGFRSSEDVVIREDRGRTLPKSLESINHRDTRAKALLDSLMEIEHIIEEKEIADRIAIEDFKEADRISKMDFDELVETAKKLF